MSQPATHHHTNYLRSILEKEKLNHTYFIVWYRNLRIVLKPEKKLYVLDSPNPDEPPQTPRGPYQSWLKHIDDSIEVSSLMLASMILDLQKDLVNHPAYDMITTLKEMFQQQARAERYDTVCALHGCKMEEGGNVSSHVLKMKSHLDHLEQLDHPYPLALATDLILNS